MPRFQVIIWNEPLTFYASGSVTVCCCIATGILSCCIYIQYNNFIIFCCCKKETTKPKYRQLKILLPKNVLFRCYCYISELKLFIHFFFIFLWNNLDVVQHLHRNKRILNSTAIISTRGFMFFWFFVTLFHKIC